MIDGFQTVFTYIDVKCDFLKYSLNDNIIIRLMHLTTKNMYIYYVILYMNAMKFIDIFKLINSTNLFIID